MMTNDPTRTTRSRLAAIDARTLVPVADEIGGVVLYINGRAAYYVLNGEWFPAVQGPGETDRAADWPGGRLGRPWPGPPRSPEPRIPESSELS